MANEISGNDTIIERSSFTSGINLGGIGTGGIEIWPDGRFHEWNIANGEPWNNSRNSAHEIDEAERVGKHYSPAQIETKVGDTDFFLRVHEEGKRPVYRWLFTGQGHTVTTMSHFWRHHKYFFIQSFESIRYRAEYPFAYLDYIDPEFPVEVRLRAWSSFITRNVKDSCLPGFFLDFTVKNLGKKKVHVSLVWQQANVAGYHFGAANFQEHRKSDIGRAHAVTMEGNTKKPDHPTSGSLSMWTLPNGNQKVTSLAANPYMQNIVWSILQTGGLEGELVPGFLKREEVNVPKDDGTMEKPTGPDRGIPPNKGWLCIEDDIEPGATAEFNCGLSWFFPNHITRRRERVGHIYCKWFGSSEDVVAYLVENRERLLAQSQLLPTEIMRSSLPEKFRLSLLDQMSTLTKNSHYTEEGWFGIQEGLGECAFNTTDVDHYASYALSCLIPQIRALVLDIQIELAHPDNGKIHHGLETVKKIKGGGSAEDGYNRWDCCCQYVLQLFRDAKWAGDRELLERSWPTAKRAMDLINSLDFYDVGLPYIEGGITYDHWRMKGIVTYMGGVYIAACRAMQKMARILGEDAVADAYEPRIAKALKGFEDLLWREDDGYYSMYYRRIEPGLDPKRESRSHEGHLDPQKPADFELDPSQYEEYTSEGLHTDAINGDATAAVLGLGTFLDDQRVRGHLKAVLENNVQPENRALVNGTYPDDWFPDEWPIMQWQTPWTGTEYFFALQCYTKGMLEEGDRIVDMVYDRHVREGMRFNHSEANDHYTRPLVIWGAYYARLGLDADFLTRTLQFAPWEKTYHGALVTGKGIARVSYERSAEGTTLEVRVLDGTLPLETLVVGIEKEAREARTFIDSDAAEVSLESTGDRATVKLSEPLTLMPDHVVRLTLA